MNRYIWLPSMLLILATGCDKGGVTDVDIQVYNGFLRPAMAIEVAPDVPVNKNEFRSWDGGFRGKQHLEISGDPTATLILVPSGHSFGLIKPDTIVYIGQRPGATTAIEISTGRWQYRRIDLGENRLALKTVPFSGNWRMLRGSKSGITALRRSEACCGHGSRRHQAHRTSHTVGLRTMMLIG